MAQIQKITTKVVVDDSSWDEWDKKVKETARDHGVAEKEILRSNKRIEQSTKKTGDQISKSAEKSKKGVGGLSKGFQQFQNVVLGGAVVGALTQILGLFNQLKAESIALFDIQAKADAQLQAALRSTGEIAGRTFEQLTAQAQALQNITLFGDEQIQGAQSVLLTFTNVREEIFDRTLPAVLDVSQALGKDLQSSAIQVGKALNDPIKGVTALAESGIQFTDQQRELIKTLVETGRTAEAQTLILKELETQFGGSAAAAAEAGTGGIQQLENKINDLKEEIGEELLPVQLELTKAQLELFSALAAVVKEGEAFQAEFRGIRTVLEIVGNSLSGVNDLFKSFGIEINAAKVAAKVLGSVISNALGFGLVEQIGRSIETTKSLFSQLREFFGFTYESIGEAQDITEDHILFQKQLTEEVKKTTEATVASSKKEQDAAKERRKDFLEQVQALRDQSELLQADAEERLRIQEARELAELEQSKAFQKLKAEDEEAAQSLINNIREKYAILQSERETKELEQAKKTADEIAKFEAETQKQLDEEEQQRLADKLARAENESAQETLLATQRIDSAQTLSQTLEQIEIARLERMLAIRREFGLATIDIEQQLAERRRAIREQEEAQSIASQEKQIQGFLNTSQQAVSLTAGFIQSINQAQLNAAEGNDEKLKQIKKRQFERNRLLGLAEVAINTAIGVSAALKNPLAAPFVIPLLIAQGLAQAAVIASQQPPTFHTGTDYVTDGTGNREVPAILERGERVVDKDTNKAYGTDFDTFQAAAASGLLRPGELSAMIQQGGKYSINHTTISKGVEIDYNKLARALKKAGYEEKQELMTSLKGLGINETSLAKAIAKELKWMK